MLLNILGIIAGLVLLVIGADRFVQGSADTAKYLGMPPLLIGLIIVGLGTSAPEILVSSIAAIQGKTEIAIGNALGSNIANIGLVLGTTVVYRPLLIRSKTLKREYLIMLLAFVATAIILSDSELGRFDGLILILCLLGSIILLIKLAKKPVRGDPLEKEFAREMAAEPQLNRAIINIIVGLFVLLLGAELVVRCAVNMATMIGISDLVIGLTIIAVGTSLPEVAASIASVIKNEADIAVGNVIGSNMFNMLAVIGIPALIHPSMLDNAVIMRDFPVMIAMTLLMGWMVFVHMSNRFNRPEGMILLLCFIAYQTYLFI